MHCELYTMANTAQQELRVHVTRAEELEILSSDDPEVYTDPLNLRGTRVHPVPPPTDTESDEAEETVAHLVERKGPRVAASEGKKSVKQRLGEPSKRVSSKTEDEINAHLTKMAWYDKWRCCGLQMTTKKAAKHHATSHYVVCICMCCGDWDPNDARLYERHRSAASCDGLRLTRVDWKNWPTTRPVGPRLFPLPRHIREGGHPGKLVDGRVLSQKSQANQFLQNAVAEATPKTNESTPRTDTPVPSDSGFRIPKRDAKRKASSAPADRPTSEPTSSSTRCKQAKTTEYIRANLPKWERELQEKARELNELHVLVLAGRRQLQREDLTLEQMKEMVHDIVSH